ncbi:pyrroline-5-carboxylate reductase [Roseospira navarrensis]|uniref:Pyrroline-5-carboxylate reductase n=1 Tax=Roseospira navarrensis TaxID=140058 RepID=A0A7X2D3X5_9PROT|nr:pyrroline-5-carboxylate reductase [Roseospira navarrensis]MQX37854.1 pyrroline-5-carboxylate reductase [Roseospira navarrensis]
MPASDLSRAALSTVRVWLVGGGKMGGALLTGWLDNGVAPDNVTIIDPAPGRVPQGVRLAADPAAPLAEGPAPDVLVLAVKPQIMDDVLPAYRSLGDGTTVALSVAAGRLIAGFEAALGAGTPVVRSIPNTPAAVHRGMTVACANAHVTETARATCDALLGAVGDIAWVDDEALIDAVTAVSGSGPAYVFWLTECMARAGVEAGLPEALAARIARATVSGAGALMDQAEEDPATLRRNVTSPNGTTAAALDELMNDRAGLGPLMTRAVAAAARRSRELAG